MAWRFHLCRILGGVMSHPSAMTYAKIKNSARSKRYNSVLHSPLLSPVPCAPWLSFFEFCHGGTWVWEGGGVILKHDVATAFQACDNKASRMSRHRKITLLHSLRVSSHPSAVTYANFTAAIHENREFRSICSFHAGIVGHFYRI